MLQSKERIQLPPLKRWRLELLEMGLQEIEIDGLCAIEANSLKGFPKIRDNQKIFIFL